MSSIDDTNGTGTSSSSNSHSVKLKYRTSGMWTAEFPISVAASDDTVPGAEIRHYIFNQYIGQDPDPTVREPHLSTTELEKHNYNIPFPANPGIPRLNHSVTAIREVHVVHSPFTPAETNTLDDLSRSAVSGLGVLELHCTSNAVGWWSQLLIEHILTSGSLPSRGHCL